MHIPKHTDRRRETWRKHHAKKKASLTPEEAKAAKEAKRAYDIEYRARTKDRRNMLRQDPEYRRKHREREGRRHAKFRAANPLPAKRTPEERAARWKAYADKYRREHKAETRQYYLKNKELISERNRKLYQQNRQRIIKRNNAYKKRRESYDPISKLISRYYTAVGRVLKGLLKTARTMQFIGCDRDTLRAHIEAQFQPGMSWLNYGRAGWHLDHKRPCASFDLSDPEQQRACFHYTNLQPLWAIDNLKKHSFYDGKHHRRVNRVLAPCQPNDTVTP